MIKSLAFLVAAANALHIPFLDNELQVYLDAATSLTGETSPRLKSSSESLFDHSCPLDLPYSCKNHTVIEDSCCFEHPGGVLLQTQFWDYYPPVGPDNMFTLHGLWPDLCSGEYEQFCDNSLNIRSVEDILVKFGETELLEKMKRIWKNFNGKDEELWIHEFNKHGTCMSTLKPHCYDTDAYEPNQNVVDFFKTSVKLFEGLPTFEWLAANGIVPSEEQTYSKQQIEDTLRAHFGQPVFIACNRFNALQEVWYFHHLKGSIVAGDYQPIPAMLNSRCPAEGIKLLPKNFKPGPTPTDGNPPFPKPTGSGWRGILKPKGHDGCLISNGRWYTKGTCATYTITKAPFGGYNVKSSKGPCGLDQYGDFACGSAITPIQFAYDKDNSFISIGGKPQWSAEELPTGFKQVPISPGVGGEVVFKLEFQKK